MTPAHFAPSQTVAELVEREKKRAKTRRLSWLLALAVLVVAGAAAAVLLKPKPLPLSERFRTQAVTSGPVVHEVSATGRLEAESSVSVGAEISGRIQTVEVDFNSKVVAGQVLARFDKATLEAQTAQTRALLAAARAQAAQARLDAEQAERNLARANALFQKQGQTEAEHEAALTAERLSKARVDATAAQVAAQEAALAVASSNLAHTEVRAPNDGVIITRNVEPGQTVSSMLQAPLLFTLAKDLKQMRAVAQVDEADIADVKVGQKASFTVTAWPERVFEGEVIEVRNSPIIVQDVVSYGVVVAAANDDLALKPGMTASVKIRTAQVDGTPRVASAALHFTPPQQKRERAEAAVFVLFGEALSKVKVTPGVSDGEVTAVAPGQLKDGDAVLVDLTPEGRRVYGVEPKR